MSDTHLTYCPRRYKFQCLIEGSQEEIDAHLKSTNNRCGVKQEEKFTSSDWFGIFRDVQGVLRTNRHWQILDHMPDAKYGGFVYRRFQIAAFDEKNGRIHIQYCRTPTITKGYDVMRDEWVYSAARIQKYGPNLKVYSELSESMQKEIDPSNIRFVFKCSKHQEQVGDYYVYDTEECEKIKETIKATVRPFMLDT